MTIQMLKDKKPPDFYHVSGFVLTYNRLLRLLPLSSRFFHQNQDEKKKCQAVFYVSYDSGFSVNTVVPFNSFSEYFIGNISNFGFNLKSKLSFFFSLTKLF